MSCYNKNSSAIDPVVRLITLLSLALAALCASPVALAVDSGDIVVVSTKGEVHFTVNGAARAVRPGGVLELPATLRTESDGAVELRQGTTTVSVGPDTLLEFPALEKRGAPIDRIVQPRGNAFYDIGKREGRKLRVETPYLVGVIKGTQFNVAVQDDGATISLFEGLLEVRAIGGDATIDLKAGEIAARKRGDQSISVLKMDGKTPASAPRAPAGDNSSNGSPSPAAPRSVPANDDESLLVDRSIVPDDIDVTAGGNASLGLGTGAAESIGVNANALPIPASGGVDLGATAANLDSGPLDVAAGTSVNTGVASPDNSAAVDLGAGSLTVAAGPVDLGSSAGLDVSGAAADLTTTTTVEAGPVTADVGAGVSVDLGAGTVDTGTTVAAQAGPLATDVGAAAAVDLGAGSVTTTVDAGVSTPLAPVDAGVSVAADVGAGTVDLGLSVAGTDLGLGLDLGLDDDGNNGHGNDADVKDSSNPGQDSDNQNPGVVDVAGLLDGLLRRRKK